MKQNYLILLFTLLFFCAKSQNLSLVSFMDNYSPEDYFADSQNWAITQSPDGALFFGNNQGLLVKDGKNWRLFNMNSQIVRAVLYHNDKIYVGGGKEFGYFRKTDFGNYMYHSLVENITKDWGEIWKIFVIEDHVFFQSGNSFFKFNLYSDQLVDRKIYNEVIFSKKLNNSILAQICGQGIVILDKELSVKEIWTDAESIKNITIRNVETINGEYYFFTLSDGILELINKKLKKIPRPIQKTLENAQIYCSLKLDNQLIIGTVLDGIYVLNSDFEVEKHLCRGTGLRNNTVLSLYADFTKDLWAGLDNGIGIIHFDTPLSLFRFTKEIGTGYAFINDGLYNYWGTNQGLFYSIGSSPDIHLIPKTQGQVWSLYRIGNSVYCGHHNGLYKVKGNTAELIDSHRGIFSINRLNGSSSYFLIISYRGLQLFKLTKDDRLEFVEKINTREVIPFKITGDNRGHFWYPDAQGFTRFSIDSTKYSMADYRRFDYADDNNAILFLKDTLFFYHKNEFFTFNHHTDKLESANFPKNLTTEETINALFKLDSRQFEKNLHTPHLSMLHMQALKPFLRPNITDRYSKFDGNYILNSYEGFTGFNDSYKSKTDTFSLKTYISQIEYKELDSASYRFLENNTLKYNHNSIRLRFATNDHRGSLTYQYRLVGLNKNFSSTKEEFKEYVNLFEGVYRFEVFAENQFGDRSAVASYSFTILPPFYRTTWAYVFYFVVVLGILYLIFRQISKSYQKKEELIRRQKQKEIQELEQQQKIDRLNHEKEIMQIEQEHLKNRIQLREQDIVNATRSTIQKNEFLMKIKDSLSSLKSETNIEYRNRHIRKISSLIESNLNTEKDWEVFEFYFNEIHRNFFKSLKSEFPNLTPTELKLCAYIRLNKSSKEISSLMNISLRGVETGRYRLRKKLNLTRDESFLDVFLRIENKNRIVQL
ncbi:MAG: hypothetical protein GX102_05945 [Porphyromonadaceae bacterium]|nr:hypothetical protein [Porphyromonadaceae bacterium]